DKLRMREFLCGPWQMPVPLPLILSLSKDPPRPCSLTSPNPTTPPHPPASRYALRRVPPSPPQGAERVRVRWGGGRRQVEHEVEDRAKFKTLPPLNPRPPALSP